MAPAAKSQSEPRAPRKKISHILVKYVRDRAPREIFNDDIATGLDLSSTAVRNSLRTVVKDHPEFGIIEVSPYVYTYVAHEPVHTLISAPPAQRRFADQPVSAAPLMHSTAGRNTGDEDIRPSQQDGVELFTVWKRLPSGDVLLNDDDHRLWVATLL